MRGVREPLDWKMSFRSRLAYVSRGKINFCAAALLLSRSPSYLLSYCSVFSNALEFQQSYVLMQNLSTYRGLRRMKFCRSPRDARGICLPRMHVIAHILAASRRFTNVHRCGSRLLLRVYFLCLVSCASPHLRQGCAAFFKSMKIYPTKIFASSPRRLPQAVTALYLCPHSPYLCKL